MYYYYTYDLPGPAMHDIRRMSDERVVEIVRARDQEAYREIIRRYQDKLLRYARYFVGDEHRAADIVQEAFIKAFVNLNGFHVKKQFSSWIYRIVHNEAINEAKKRDRELPLSSQTWIAETLADDTDLETWLVQKDARDALVSCIQSLPASYRAPLSLFFLEECSYEEISDILHLPVGTVGTRIRRGKKLILRLYQHKGGVTV